MFVLFIPCMGIRTVAKTHITTVTSLCVSVRPCNCPSVNPSVRVSVCLCIRLSMPFALNGFFVKCDTGNAHEYLLRKFKFLLKSGKNMGHLSWRTKNVLFFPGTLNRHKRVLCRVKSYKDIETGEEEQMLCELDSVLRYTYIVCLDFLLFSTAH
jgi:hypothetical protein